MLHESIKNAVGDAGGADLGADLKQAQGHKTAK